jgi:hypothetical protein
MPENLESSPENFESSPKILESKPEVLDWADMFSSQVQKYHDGEVN